MKSAFVKFSDATTVHGVRETVVVRNKFWKLIWFIFLSASILATAYFIAAMCISYSQEPTTTKLSWLKQEFYESPPMSFCPSRWINSTTATKLGIGLEALSFIQNMTPAHLETDNFAIHSEEILFGLFTLDITSMRDFNWIIALDVEEVIACEICSFSKIHQVFQICYNITYGPISKRALYQNSTTELRYKNVYRAFDLDGFSGTLIIGENAYSAAAVHGIRTRPGHVYMVKVSPKQIITLSKGSEPCNNHVGVDVSASADVARMNCQTREMGEQIFCHYCAAVEKMQVVKDNFTFWFRNLPWYRNSSLKNQCRLCVKDLDDPCLMKDFVPPCKRWVYEYTFNTEQRSKTEDLDSFFAIEYAPIYGIEVLEEVQTYTWESFLSNIGGQLGLWLGASFLSCFQVVYYLCIEPFSEWTKRTHNRTKRTMKRKSIVIRKVSDSQKAVTIMSQHNKGLD